MNLCSSAAEDVSPHDVNIDLTHSSVLVTGATGFLGRHLVPRLVEAGARVHATTRTERPTGTASIGWIPLDLTNGRALRTVVESLQPDLVIHLGGRVSGAVDPGPVMPTFDTLLASSITLLSAAHDGSVGRLVLVGSNDEPPPGATPASPFGAAKGAMTAYAKLCAEAFAAPVVCVGPAEAYGPGQAPVKLLPYVAAAGLRGESPRLAGGTRLGDLMYIDDVIDGLLLAALRAGDDLDLGTGVLHGNREVVERLLEALGVDVRPVWGALPDRPRVPERAADVARAARARAGERKFRCQTGSVVLPTRPGRKRGPVISSGRTL